MSTGSMCVTIAAGVKEALDQACQLPMMFTALRNGGAESLLRALVNQKLEEATGCVAFSEAEKRRADLALRRPDDGEVVAFIEFKHNFARQSASIKSEVTKAKLQLKNQRRTHKENQAPLRDSVPATDEASIENRLVCVYVHFLVSLVHGDGTAKTSFVQLHDRNVVSYKKFVKSRLSDKHMRGAIDIAEAELGSRKPAEHERENFFVTCEIKSGEERCRLMCWAFVLEGDSFIPLRLMGLVADK